MAWWTVTGKASGLTMGSMFAPYCATCGSRRLLSFHRVVASDWERGGSVYVRCTCGSVIDANARPPDRTRRRSDHPTDHSTDHQPAA